MRKDKADDVQVLECGVTNLDFLMTRPLSLSPPVSPIGPGRTRPTVTHAGTARALFTGWLLSLLYQRTAAVHTFFFF